MGKIASAQHFLEKNCTEHIHIYFTLHYSAVIGAERPSRAGLATLLLYPILGKLSKAGISISLSLRNTPETLWSLWMISPGPDKEPWTQMPFFLPPAEKEYVPKKLYQKMDYQNRASSHRPILLGTRLRWHTNRLLAHGVSHSRMILVIRRVCINIPLYFDPSG